MSVAKAKAVTKHVRRETGRRDAPATAAAAKLVAPYLTNHISPHPFIPLSSFLSLSLLRCGPLLRCFSASLTAFKRNNSVCATLCFAFCWLFLPSVARLANCHKNFKRHKICNAKICATNCVTVCVCECVRAGAGAGMCDWLPVCATCIFVAYFSGFPAMFSVFLNSFCCASSFFWF